MLEGNADVRKALPMRRSISLPWQGMNSRGFKKAFVSIS
jgi:hypothetical protein